MDRLEREEEGGESDTPNKHHTYTTNNRIPLQQFNAQLSKHQTPGAGVSWERERGKGECAGSQNEPGARECGERECVGGVESESENQWKGVGNGSGQWE